MNYKATSFTGKEDYKLCRHSWTVNDAKASILLIHGFGEHAKRYDREATVFNEAGYDVIAYDQRSHGKSDGQLGYIDDFQHYIQDLSSFIDAANKEKPFIIFAHSFGGLVTTTFLIDTKFSHPNFKGVMYTAPFLIPDKNTAPWLQKVAGVLGKITPKLKTINIDSSAISRIKEEVDKYDSDPLVFHDKIYAGTAAQMLHAQKQVQAKFDSIEYDFLIQHGQKDGLAELAGSQMLYDKAKSKSKKLHIWPEGFHELTRDLEQEKVMEMMVKWADERV